MDYIVSHTPVWVIQSETFRRPENYGKEQNDSFFLSLVITALATKKKREVGLRVHVPASTVRGQTLSS